MHEQTLPEPSLFERCRSTLRSLGLAAGLLYALKRALERLSGGHARLHVYYLVAQPVSAQPALPAKRGRSIDVREVSEQEALGLPIDRPRAVIADRFRQKARCLVASKDGRFLGCLWFKLGPYEEDELRCLFVPSPSGAASWDFDVFVDPSARLGLAFARLWDEANSLLSSCGFGWTLSRISAFNTGSLAAHRRFGSKRVGTVGFLCRGPFQLMVSSVKPYVHVAFRRSSRPVIEVGAS